LVSIGQKVDHGYRLAIGLDVINISISLAPLRSIAALMYPTYCLRQRRSIRIHGRGRHDQKMQRRDLVKTLALVGGAAGVLPMGVASATESAGSGDGAAGQAWLDLAAAMVDVERRYETPPYGTADPIERAEARGFMAEVLQTALLFWADADPDRPTFTRFTTPHQKLIGDNPDAIYYFAPINPSASYRLRGAVVGEVYTSFTVERGTADGSGSKGLAATINDTQFDVRPDGTYEITVGGPPQPRNWLALAPDAGSLTTRHYFELARSAAADPTLHVPLTIEPLDRLAPPPPRDEAQVAASLRRVARFFQWMMLDFPPVDVPHARPASLSKTANQFPLPEPNVTTRGLGYAARDNVYLQTEYVLAPDEALVMRGRFPRCRFANVMLWNRYWQTYDFVNRRISLNRRQTTLEPDGSFRMVIAHRDPGVPNWIDTAGRPRGYVFWRFMLPEGAIEPVRTEVVKIGSLTHG
jgi:hypothetical protein